MMLEVGAPIVAAMAQADDNTKAIIKQQVFEKFNAENINGGAKLKYAALIISGQK